MKFSLKWLRDFVQINCSASELADRLTMAGFEVEEIDEVGASLKHIITAKITKIDPHPNADRLVVTQVDDGKETHQIVTGATNIKVGDIVPVSLPGSVLANGMTLKQSKLRGVDSFGMLCSEVELGVAEESDGIWILDDDTPIGVDFIGYGHLQDTIFDIAILPNRGDCQSIFGLAREIAAILKTSLLYPDFEFEDHADDTLKVSIQVEDADLCPLYTARLIRHVKHKPTPLWMTRRLELSGIRPISLLVDITNYVLVELGQPLHAFDYHHLDGHKIIVKTAKKGSSFHTLDQEDTDEARALLPTDLMICDAKKPVALAGVMGGKNSEVHDNTQDILLESAFFHPNTVRRSASRLGLRTESSIRFERGIDYESVVLASNRASYFYHTLAEGVVIKPVYEKRSTSYPLFKPNQIVFSDDGLNRILGTSLSTTELLQPLQDLGFQYNHQVNVLSVPSWRKLDIQELPCLAEEISRLIGLDAIPSQLPHPHGVQDDPPIRYQGSKTIIQYLIARGLSQVCTFPMISPDDCTITNTNIKDCYCLKNPLTPVESVMRTQLFSSLLKVVSHHLHRQMPSLAIFDIGQSYHRGVHQSEPTETHHCTALFTGNWIQSPYKDNHSVECIDFFELKGLLQGLFNALTLPVLFEPLYDQPLYHPKIAMRLSSGDTEVGHFGRLHPKFTKAYDCTQPVAFFDLNLDAIFSLSPPTPSFQSFSKFPSTRRDIALLAPRSLSYDDIVTVITTHKPEKVDSFFLFDCFESGSLGDDKKSLAFAFIYQDDKDTLSDKQVNKAHQSFCQILTDKLPISIR